jgi:hypothetical protein
MSDRAVIAAPRTRLTGMRDGEGIGEYVAVASDDVRAAAEGECALPTLVGIRLRRVLRQLVPVRGLTCAGKAHDLAHSGNG